MRNPKCLVRALDAAEAVFEQARLAEWSTQAVGWINTHGDSDDRDALARRLAALLRERSLSAMLDLDIIDEASQRLVEREQGLAVALTELDLGAFSDEDAGRLARLMPSLPAEFSPLAEMFAASLDGGAALGPAASQADNFGTP
jgi:hypothetical protein